MIIPGFRKQFHEAWCRSPSQRGLPTGEHPWDCAGTEPGEAELFCGSSRDWWAGGSHAKPSDKGGLGLSPESWHSWLTLDVPSSNQCHLCQFSKTIGSAFKFSIVHENTIPFWLAPPPFLFLYLILWSLRPLGNLKIDQPNRKCIWCFKTMTLSSGHWGQIALEQKSPPSMQTAVSKIPDLGKQWEGHGDPCHHSLRPSFPATGVHSSILQSPFQPREELFKVRSVTLGTWI